MLHHSRQTSRRAVLGLLAACTALAGSAAPSSAATIRFGTDLDAAPANDNASTTCAAGTWWYTGIGNVLSSASTGSCQFTAVGFAGGTTYGLNTPASGTVTSARVKVGATTGPMRINVVRTLFQQTGSAASPLPSTPFLQAYGPTFTPTANAVTTVPLNLPVTAQPSPAIGDTSTVAGVDWLALEVLSPTVPVPLVPSPGAVFFAAFPGPTASNVPAPSPNPLPNYGQIGYVVAMNADLTTPGSDPAPTPVPAPTGPGGAGGTGGAGPTVGLTRKTAQVSGGRAALDILCQAACSGEVTLQRTTGGKAAATNSLGRAKFSGEADKAIKVRVKLNSRGKALLKTKRKASVQASFKLTGAATPTVVAVTLRR